MTPIKVLVYINGVRFEPRSVSVTATVGQHATFSIDVPPVRQWAILPARSPVAVFFTDPVTNRWRLLVEGEYVSPSFGKSADGRRYRTLMCRSLHGWWEDTTYTQLGGMFAQDPSSTLVSAYANGIPLTNTTPQIQPLSLGVLLQRAAAGNNPGAWFRTLLAGMLAQTPVESFYSTARRVLDKLFTLEDRDAASILDWSRFQDLATNGLNTLGFTPNMTVAEIISRYESLAHYVHTPVLAPPLSTGDLMPQMLFLPYLYHAVPPASNVIFDDQIIQSSGTLDLLGRPTRLVVSFSAASNNGAIPQQYMVNSLTGLTNVTQAAGVAPELALTHDLLTQEELTRGVHTNVPLPLDYAQLGSTASETKTSIEAFIQQAARHEFQKQRAQRMARTITCTFQPYVLPGFPVVVEELPTSIQGYLASVTHTLSNEGQSTTQLQISNVDELYVVDGANRTAPFPVWMNRAFYPSNIANTYEILFGQNAETDRESTAVPEDDITPERINQPGYLATEQCNLDRLLGLVVDVPIYDPTTQKFVRLVSQDTIAARLRDTALPHRAFYRFQFRSGTYIEDYARFHGLASGTFDREDPPEDFSPAVTAPLFAIPSTHTLVASAASGPAIGTDLQRHGMFETGSLSDERQKAARVIAEAIRRTITRG